MGHAFPAYQGLCIVHIPKLRAFSKCNRVATPHLSKIYSQLSCRKDIAALPVHVAAIACLFLSSGEPLYAIDSIPTPYGRSITDQLSTGLLDGCNFYPLPRIDIMLRNRLNTTLYCFCCSYECLDVIANQFIRVLWYCRRIRPCPSDINPNCVSTSSKYAGYAIPWLLYGETQASATKKIEEAILSLEKNPKILKLEPTRGGNYLVAEVDGLFGRDVLEFLIGENMVTYRSMAKKVMYFYPFTTPLSDLGRQQKRIQDLQDELGWGAPSFESFDFDS